MDAQARRAALLKRLTRASALAAALLGVLIYAGVSGLPSDVQGWFVSSSQPQVTQDNGAPSDEEAPAPAAPAQVPNPSAGGPVQARTGAS
ncbi:MAG: hypothetical protein JF924_04230 [Candidatus Dormibacteraeota bacterium]|nr:hypothetical protein [Candidatus Dormibacteraeota bacterium]